MEMLMSGTSEVSQKTSPRTPRSARQLKTTGSESDSASSTHPTIRTPTDRSPKVPDRRSPRSPVLEMKRLSKVTELETQLAQLQEDLKKAKDQLVSSESCKARAQQEAEEAKKQLLAMAAKLENSQHQLVELSAAEEDRLQELRKISQDRDRAWESEIEALQKQHSVDSATLSSAMNEIQRLKLQLELVSESEAAHAKQAEMEHTELQSLKLKMVETLSFAEHMKAQVSECKESEARAQLIVNETSLELETAKTTIEMLRSDGFKAFEALNSVIAELEVSRACENSLKEVISKLESDLAVVTRESANKSSQTMGESEQLTTELSSAKSEVKQLRAALEEAEIKYHEEEIRNTMQIQSAYELVELTKSGSNQREAKLEAELKQTKAEIIEMKAKLMDKETALQGILAENEGLNLEMAKNRSSPGESELEVELNKVKAYVSDLKANLMDKETELQSISEENEMLKSEIDKRERQSVKGIAEAEAAREAEREALTRLGYVTEEAEKSSRRATRVAEQLEAAQVANSEMESELRTLRVQSDQWRKAAEAAAAVLSTSHNGKFMDRSASLDGEYHPIGGKIMGSPYSEDMDDDSPKKKNNMLKRIGVLWKKGQK
ncbi:interactor of constitutive active ROPs 2, chloroplastic-like isoform X2 [Tasmannia lanceolata]|uniref:interactor of constitutive active ROPs 2, chloroplastic-like isoform X2 n=1 Tax=Tasmannia lanceolata TaxID=3420 RepID=UPI0040637339